MVKKIQITQDKSHSLALMSILKGSDFFNHMNDYQSLNFDSKWR